MGSALIIGAGMGGITLAARLARRGVDVTVLEKNSGPGGRVAQLKRDGFTFDMGPTLLLMPWLFRDTYRALGYDFDARIALKRIEPNYRFFFHDQTVMDSSSDLVKLGEHMERIEPGSSDRLMHFMDVSARHYRLSLKHMVDRNFYNLRQFLALKNLPLLARLHTYQSHAAFTSKHFATPKLHAAFSYQNMYMGLSSWDAPATYSFLQYLELAEGIWMPKGGYYTIVEDLVRIAEDLGATFQYDAEVDRIAHARDRVTGVTLRDGRSIGADTVIVNADLPYAYRTLLDEGRTWRRLKNQRYTNSCFMYYWGVKDADLSPLTHHNAFLGEHIMKECADTIFKDYGVPEEPSFYVNIPSRTDPAMVPGNAADAGGGSVPDGRATDAGAVGAAPNDAAALTVLVPVGYIDEKHPQNWEAEMDRVREFVFDRMAAVGADVRGKVLFEKTIGPEDYRSVWNLARGAAFGLGHKLTQMGYLRPHNRHKRLGNLYFVGASTHPGTGVPLVMVSAKLVEERMVHDRMIEG